jgi:AbiV family abortive infection protein
MPKNQQPKRDAQLYSCLFDDPERSLTVLSQGIVACADNARRLLRDAACLKGSKGFSSALFLTTTAREEVAKAYILLDACLLDRGKHKPELRRQCRAFYSHIAKYAYLEVLRVRGLRKIRDVSDWWQGQIRRWSEGAGPESGEPAFFPHPTYYVREGPLYVDYDDYADEWAVPEDVVYQEYFGSRSFLERATDLFKPLREAQVAGFLRPDSLAVLNSVFSPHYLSDGSSWVLINRLYAEAAGKLESKLGLSANVFLNSALVRWPLYPCVVQWL